MILIYLIVFFILITVIEKTLINKFNIKKKRGLYKPVNKVHKWSEIVLFIALSIIGFFIFSSEFRQYYMPMFFTVFFGFRAFMEWKFEKESKAYILSILSGSMGLLIFIILQSYL